MAPLANQIHVDSLLSNISIKYQPSEFIAMQVFPELQVKKTSDLYRIYDRNFRVPETQRSNRAEAREHNFEVSTASYLLQRHSLKSFVSDTDAQNYDLADLRAETTEELSNVLLRRLELQVGQLFTSTNWSLNASLASTLQFDDNTTLSNPIQVFQTAASTIIQFAGFRPNFGILPRDGMVACVNHISVADRLKYTSAEIDAAKLAALFDLGELLIPSAAYDTSALGTADTTTNIAPFFGDNAFVGYKPQSPGILKPSSGYIFRNVVPMVKRWRVEEREADCIEVNMEFQAKIVASLSGYLIKDILN